MDRRDFIRGGLVAGATISMDASETATSKSTAHSVTFKLNYAPELGRFHHHAGDAVADQIAFIHEQGFRAIFDNTLMFKTVEQQNEIAAAARKYEMTLGPFVVFADFTNETMVRSDTDIRREILKAANRGIETAKRTGCKWGLMIPGVYNQSMDRDFQTVNVIDNMKYVAEVCEDAGLVIVLEPLNKRDHPGLFLTRTDQAYQICQAVNHPCCKIIYDVYHQQITEGDLMRNITLAWSHIAGIHVGDNPGRNEPGTGEINYRNIFRHLYHKGYEGPICMEHGFSLDGKRGEKIVLEAYRFADSF